MPNYIMQQCQKTYKVIFGLDLLKYKTAKEVTTKLKVIFSTHGVPTIFMPDNMLFRSNNFLPLLMSRE